MSIAQQVSDWYVPPDYKPAHTVHIATKPRIYYSDGWVYPPTLEVSKGVRFRSITHMQEFLRLSGDIPWPTTQ